MDYLKFTREQWQQVEASSKDEFSDSLGGRPTRKGVEKKIPNNHGLDPLTKIAILMLLVVSIFGAFKLGLTAYPLATRLVEQNLHTALPPVLQGLLVFSVVASAGFAGVYGMIYFKLVSETSVTAKKMEMSKRTKKYLPSWWSPRLPFALVILTVAIMFIVSNTANASIFDWFFNNTIVVMELALSYPVSIWMSKRQGRNEAVNREYMAQLNAYERVMSSAENDKRYLRILFQRGAEALFTLRSGRRGKTNEDLRQADTRTVEAIITAEYKRLRGGVGFGNEIATWLTEEPQPSTMLHAIHRSQQTKKASVGRKRKPVGDTWDADSLRADMMQHGAPVPATQNYIRDNYVAGHGAQNVWRTHVRDSWNS
jgi:uncharacterized protein (DUF2062 family)